MLRWTIRILIIFVVLVIAAAVVAHLILRSDWLDKRILARIGERTGMDVAAKSLSVGWGGGTTVHEVTVKMPLSDEVVFTADRIRLKHEAIPLLILRRRINVRSVWVENPEVRLRQDEDGRWNVQDAWTQWKTRRRPRIRPKRRTPLPQLVIQDALVQVADSHGTSQTLGPLNFRADRKGLVWPFNLEAPGVVRAQGRVLQDGDWKHNVGFATVEIAPLIHHILGGDLSPIQAAGGWEGRFSQGVLSGTIRLDKLIIGPLAARGTSLVQAESGQITVRPQGLVFSEPNLAGREIQLTSGSVRIADGQIHVEQLTAESSRLIARIDGSWDWAARAGEFAGSWTGASGGRPSSYYGTYRASVASPRSGRKAARVSMTAEAETSLGELTVSASAEGDGADWRQSRWQISAPAFVWSRKGKEVDMAGTAAEIHLAWPEIGLTSLHLPDANTTAAAQFDASTRRWSARLATENLRQLKPWGFESLDFRLNAEGDDRKAIISDLRVAQGGRVATAKGELSLREKGFQNVRVTADWPAGSPGPDRPGPEQPMSLWRLEGDVSGRIEPLNVEIVGQLTGRNIALGKQQLSRVEIPVQATADERWVRMATDPFGMLGGTWRLKGEHDLATDFTQINIAADNLSLEAAAGIAGLPAAPPLSDVSRPRQGRAQAQLQAVVPGFDLERAVATGDWSAEDINIPPLRAQRAHGKLRIDDGLVRFDEIVLEQEGGRIQANTEFPIDHPQLVSIELTADGWPIRFEDRPVSILADGRASLQFNAIERIATGEAKISAGVAWAERNLARVHLYTLVHGQVLDIREFRAETLGGSVAGQAMVPLDHWQGSTAKLGWQGIQPKLLGAWAPQLERFEGVASGSFTVEREDQASRPPEPMRFVLDAAIENGRFGQAQVGDCRIVGFFGDRRLLIDQADFRVLDGQLKARSRVSTHAGKPYGSVAIDFNDLRLGQLVHTIDPNASEHPGNLAGTATVLISAREGMKGISPLPSLQGEARLSLTQSDLVGNSVVRALYNALNQSSGPQEPTGTGEVTARLEGHSLLIPSFIYFNRGVEIRGAWEIEDIHRGGTSPVDGFAVASTRVLKGIQLPGVRELDRLLATFQTGAASVKIGGTLEQIDVKVVPLPEVQSSLRRLLWAQLHE